MSTAVWPHSSPNSRSAPASSTARSRITSPSSRMDQCDAIKAGYSTRLEGDAFARSRIASPSRSGQRVKWPAFDLWMAANRWREQACSVCPSAPSLLASCPPPPPAPAQPAFSLPPPRSLITQPHHVTFGWQRWRKQACPVCPSAHLSLHPGILSPFPRLLPSVSRLPALS